MKKKTKRETELKVWFTNKEKQDLVNKKGDLTWKQYILRLAKLNKKEK